jgi:hypothetical protein
VADDRFTVEFGRSRRDHMRAIAQNGDAVGDRQRLFQCMADEDDGDAAFTQALDEAEEVMLLFRRECRRRFIKDDDAGTELQRTRDLHHLFLAGAERGDVFLRIDREVERVEQLLGSDVEAAQTVEEALVAQEDVLRHRHRRDERGFLVDHGDAGMQCRRRIGKADRFAVDEDLAFTRRHGPCGNLHQRRLAGAVFAEQRMDFAGLDGEGHILHCGHRAVELADAAQLKHGS